MIWYFEEGSSYLNTVLDTLFFSFTHRKLFDFQLIYHFTSELQNDDALRNFGWTARNDLNQLTNAESKDENEISIESILPFKTIDTLPEYIVCLENGSKFNLEMRILHA